MDHKQFLRELDALRKQTTHDNVRESAGKLQALSAQFLEGDAPAETPEPKPRRKRTGLDRMKRGGTDRSEVDEG